MAGGTTTKTWLCRYIGPGGVEYGITCYGPTEETVIEKHKWLKGFKVDGEMVRSSFIQSPH